MEVDYKKTVEGVREDMRNEGIDDTEYDNEYILNLIEQGF